MLAITWMWRYYLSNSYHYYSLSEATKFYLYKTEYLFSYLKTTWLSCMFLCFLICLSFVFLSLILLVDNVLFPFFRTHVITFSFRTSFSSLIFILFMPFCLHTKHSVIHLHVFFSDKCNHQISLLYIDTFQSVLKVILWEQVKENGSLLKYLR